MRYTKMTKCHFCDNEATAYNKQKTPCCSRHKNQETKNVLQCICGEAAELLHGKFGSYVKCPNCGNVTLKKINRIL